MKPGAQSSNALKIPVPKGDRSQIDIGIVHFGVGGFRAHHGDIVDHPRFVLFEDQS
jgi:mannitol 2-dehydrogenase